ncbi:MAG TPA: Npt1/Npt2 family nucleotide transporter [Rhabdochlamydiaceae bacterium]|jgi:AAA family ATP:ADP antiporter
MFEKIAIEFRGLARSERLFILFALLCSFLIQADYATIRPVSNALFITHYGAQILPYAWFAAIPLNMLLVSWYNKYLPLWGCFKTFLCLSSAIVGFNLFCTLFIDQIAWLPFAFYVWKEVYIMLMFQQLWSVIHSTIPYARAKYLYGIVFGIGACGALVGSYLPGFCAVKYGSSHLLLATLPIYLLLGICYSRILRYTHKDVGKIEDEPKRNTTNAFFHGIALVRSSPVLLFILLIVILMQISSSLIDYQFNFFLEKHVLGQDLRTQYTARTLAYVHGATLILQFLGSFFFIHFLGLRRSHFFIPCILGLNNLAFLILPSFGLITFSYITVKSFDFSLFGVIKEIMYIPLKKDEKFRAKAFIDVFTYRTSKALASLLIFALQWLITSAHLGLTLTLLGFSLFCLWCFLVIKMLKSEPAAQGV